MKFKIDVNEATDKTLEYLFSLLPPYFKASILDFLSQNKITYVNEIRIKKNSFICLIADSKNIKTDIYVNDFYMEELFLSLCQGSIYAHIETIKDGYISLGQGLRAGICGTAVLDGKNFDKIKNISSINIRIPGRIYGASSYLFNLLKKSNFNKSILLYSPPGVGKTSILRDLIIKLNSVSPPIRFSVIDSREEIITPYFENCIFDVFLSYPKGLAIELATKSMTPQIIICDEISSEEEAISILKASHNGVKLIATTHASTYNEVSSKIILKPLIESNIFDYFIGVNRQYGEKKYSFTLNECQQNKKWKLLAHYVSFSLRFLQATTMKNL